MLAFPLWSRKWLVRSKNPSHASPPAPPARCAHVDKTFAQADKLAGVSLKESPVSGHGCAPVSGGPDRSFASIETSTNGRDVQPFGKNRMQVTRHVRPC